jgi:PGF-pre-PGF domain-containing protein
LSEEEFFINRIRILLLAFLIFTVVSGAGAAAEPVAHYAYITNYQSGNVSIINMTTDTVTATVPVEGFPVGVAASPDGRKVYVANSDSENVSVIDTATNTVIATVNVGSLPWGVAVNPEGSKVYVANLLSNSISIIDIATNAVTATVDVGNGPSGVAVNDDGTRVYVTNTHNDNVSIIDAATNTVTAVVNVGGSPHGVTVNGDGTRVYVTNRDSNSISVIDTATNDVVATLNVGNYPEGIIANPDGTKIYVTNRDSDTVSVIDTTTNNVTDNIPVGNYPEGISVTSDGTKVYVANWDSNTVSVIDTATNNVTATVNVESSPYAFGQFIASVPSVLPVANFTANTTSGLAPLTVQFNDYSENADSREWDFENDGFSDSVEQDPVYTFVSAGSYEVNLTVSNEYGNNSKIITITVQNSTAVLPIADFSASTTSGYAPLTVQFTDRSQHATGWTWTFGDGGISTDRNPSHTYSTAGTYTVYLIVSNGNSTASKTATINVYQTSNGGSSGGGSSGGGGVGGSPESARNIEVKELSQAYITNGNSVKFDFAKKATCVVYVSFDAKKTTGKTTSNVEMLRGKSMLVPALPSGIIYKSLNIWVGNAGFATPTNIENAVICFKVEKAWIKDKKIDPDSITLYRYNDGKWNKLETSLSEEDNKYLYFIAKTPGFSPFVIKGESTTKEAGNETVPKNNTLNSGENITPGAEPKTPTEKNTENSKIPGFKVVYGIISLCTLLLYKKTRHD